MNNPVSPADVEQYLTVANSDVIRCVDERPTAEPFTAGIAVPGAIYGIIDAVKTLKHLNETEARELVVNAGIPLGAHVDEHHGAKGCGYAKLVETAPASLTIADAVPADDRLSWIKDRKARVLTYLHDHNPKAAVIIYRPDKTLDSPKAWSDGTGIFDMDAWILPGWARKLAIDDTAFTKWMIELYKNTVVTLTNGSVSAFTEIL